MAVVEKESGKLTESLVLARTRAQDLDSVRKLNCWASNISDVSIIKQMKNLEVCSLSGNKISTLKDFSYCQNLQELYIRKNNIQTLQDIHWLKKLSKLRVLWLSDNVCAAVENYRLTVLKTLPNIQKLDNIAVTEDEINRALEEGDELPFPDDFLNNESIPIESLPEPIENCVDLNVTEEPKLEALKKHKQPDQVSLTLEQTNKIREELGLKPLQYNKISTTKSNTTGITKSRNTNILQAALLLVKELDKDSLEILENAIKSRMETL